jgi:hypothetical protein
MLAGERIAALRMIEARRVLPPAYVMAARARSVEPSTVRIGVTTRAIALETYPAGVGLSLGERCRLGDAKLRFVT